MTAPIRSAEIERAVRSVLRGGAQVSRVVIDIYALGEYAVDHFKGMNQFRCYSENSGGRAFLPVDDAKLKVRLGLGWQVPNVDH